MAFLGYYSTGFHPVMVFVHEKCKLIIATETLLTPGEHFYFQIDQLR